MRELGNGAPQRCRAQFIGKADSRSSESRDPNSAMFRSRINVEQLGNVVAAFRIHQSAESQAADWLISIFDYISIGRVRGVPLRQRSSDNNPCRACQRRAVRQRSS